MAITQEVEDVIFGFDSSAGQVDNPVLVLLEKVQEYGEDVIKGKNAIGKPFYIMRMCEIFQLGIPTPNQIDAVIRAFKKVQDRYDIKPYLVIETTGMGLPNYQQFEQALPNVHGIHPTGEGSTVSQEGRIYKVPKVDLGSELQVLYENGRFLIPAGIKERKKIIKQFVNFTWIRKESGTLTVENLKSSDHDDVCDAAAVAAWFGTYGIRKFRTMAKPPGL